MMLLRTDLTPLAWRASVSARLFSSADLAKPLSCTIPSSVSTPIAVAATVESLAWAALTAVVIAASLVYSFTDSSPRMTEQALTLNGARLTGRASGALWWAEERLLCVADLHLGKSERIARRGGALLPPYETAETLDRDA